MPATLPKRAAMRPYRPKIQRHRIGVVLGSLLFLLFPPLLLILVAAACLGHGQISFESILAVFVATEKPNS